MFSKLVGLLILVPLVAGPQVEGASTGPTVGIVVDESGAPDALDAGQLESAATTLLEDKLPEVRVESGLRRLTLWIQPTCVEDGSSCDLDVELLRLPRWAGEAAEGYPFGYRPHLVLWRAGALLVATSDQMQQRSRAWLDAELDTPVTAWLGLPEEERSCWLSYLGSGDEADAFALPSGPGGEEQVQLEEGTDASTAYREGFEMGSFLTWVQVRKGPCQAAGEARANR